MTTRNQSSLYYSSGSLQLDVENSEDHLSPSIEALSNNKDHHHDDPLLAENECVADQGNSLPPERQYQIVDMERDDMDMLEWLIRFVIPIPKRYYWESPTTHTTLPSHVRVWHDMIGLFDTCIQWLDQTSEPWIQPTTSRFEYVRSTMTPQQLERFQKQQVELRKRRQRAIEKDDHSTTFVVRGSE